MFIVAIISSPEGTIEGTFPGVKWTRVSAQDGGNGK
jgi:hypothetical protein